MFSSLPRLLCVAGWIALLVSSCAAAAKTGANSPAASTRAASLVPTLTADGLGKGSIPLDGPWQFHLGDDPAWADPNYDDSQWEQLTADKPWGSQGHPNYQGYAWYRRHLDLSPAPGASPDFALLIPAIDDAYEMFWNGVPVGQLGAFPPHLNVYYGLPPQTYGLGPIRSGVLAFRVYKIPFASIDDGTAGGFEGVPVLGSPEAIGNLKGATDFRWLRAQQHRFGLTTLYVLASLLAFVAWLRDRKQRLLLWMAIYTGMPLLDLYLTALRVPVSGIWLQFFTQTEIQFREVSQWYVLLWLLHLNVYPKLTRFLRIAAWISMVGGVLDGALSFLLDSLSPAAFGWTDAFFTVFILIFEAMPAVLVVFAILRKQKLDSARWIVAIFATTAALFYAVSNFTLQGCRFTHWTIGTTMTNPIFTIFGSAINTQSLLRTLLFVSIVYAVVRYSIDNGRRQSAMEAEFQNARELQQVLVPENLPPLPGFALTSAYRPAAEVGGDFFQIIPLEDGATLVILGDVSGKGLKAAMAVSMIVGATRMIAEYTPNPGEILAGLNRRLYGRMSGGFATAIVMRMDAKGSCTLASAGHPAPFLNQRELDLKGALPLGVTSDAAYEEQCFKLQVGDHFALYTDGLLEARSQTGELYGFERLETLFATRPNATQASEAAVVFGQDDDITVLTLTRLATAEESSASHSVPKLAPV
jgi:hypothetical protein